MYFSHYINDCGGKIQGNSFLQVIPLGGLWKTKCFERPSIRGKKMKKVNSDCALYGSAFCLSFFFFLQCQWAHIGGSLHSRTTASFRIPNDVFWTVLAANLLYAATPILVALRVYSNPYFFLKISPFPGQTGLPNSIEKDTKYKDK